MKKTYRQNSKAKRKNVTAFLLIDVPIIQKIFGIRFVYLEELAEFNYNQQRFTWVNFQNYQHHKVGISAKYFFPFISSFEFVIITHKLILSSTCN